MLFPVLPFWGWYPLMLKIYKLLLESRSRKASILYWIFYFFFSCSPYSLIILFILWVDTITGTRHEYLFLCFTKFALMWGKYHFCIAVYQVAEHCYFLAVMLVDGLFFAGHVVLCNSFIHFLWDERGKTKLLVGL
ncbi:hypothetical protein GDO81_022499 [Engystomops pustulosus]|uniref:Uncharacterized protein n=1 Tax=Engystomops pustulosus TaxID=76066 RepID=A0AAV6YTQ9_ENGPU|nr:hypothetical protein GDO81_022499 [Engystomops pustulosus]